MKIIDNYCELDHAPKDWVVTIGNFDGVHKGHQEIIRIGKELVEKHSARGLAVVTFDPHPVALLRPEKTPGVLSPLLYKKHLLEELGVDCLVVIRDSLKLLNMSPEKFVDEFLVGKLGPKAVVEGANFNFGYGRSGTVETLEGLGLKRGFGVNIVDLSKIKISDKDMSTVSSSNIRRFIESGRVLDASKMLSRPYRLIGNTVSGRGIGRTIGFPTANIEPHNQILPGEGVYAGRVQIGDSFDEVCVPQKTLEAVFSIGRAKTFISDHPLLMEAHILETTDPAIDDLYGKWLALDFVELVRLQERFESKELLKAQIAKDCGRAMTILRS